jgi:hypothetical protein
MDVPCSQELIAELLALSYNAVSLRQCGILLLYVGSFSPGGAKKNLQSVRKPWLAKVLCLLSSIVRSARRND